MLYFCFYELFTRILKGNDVKAANTPLQQVIAGGVTGIFSWGICFPADSLKSMAQTESLTDPVYKNYRHMIKTVLQEQGFKGLYKGYNVCLARAFPVNAITFLFYEQCRNILVDVRKNSK